MDKENESFKFVDLPVKLDEIIDPSENYLEQRWKVIDLLSSTEITLDDYLPYWFVNSEKKYTWNLVVQSDKFNIIMLVWNPKRESPIHDHPCNGCWVWVLENEIRETVYDKSEEGTLETTADNVYWEGGVTWMHDVKGFHKIGNPGEEIAVTMHVYSPPFEFANVINEDMTKTQCIICYDSEGGVPVTTNHTSQVIKSITDGVK